MHAIVNGGADAISLEDLLNKLALVVVQVETLDSGLGRKLNCPTGALRALLVQRGWLHARGIIAQFIQVLRGLNVPGIDLQGLDQRRARAGRVPAQTVFGSGLDQCRHCVAARNFAGQPVIRIGPIQPCGLLVVVDRLFIALVHEELAGAQVELGRAPPVAVAGQFRLVGGSGCTLRGGRLCGEGLCGLSLDCAACRRRLRLPSRGVEDKQERRSR